MTRKRLVWTCLASLVSAISGCSCLTHHPAAELESQVISTRGTMRLDIAMSDRTNISILAGTLDNRDDHDVSMQQLTQFASLQPSDTLSGSGVFTRVAYNERDLGNNDPAPLVQQGWIYVIRPPAWPVARTPGTRGGTPAADVWDGTVQLIAQVDGDVQRFIFVGALDANNKSIPAGCRLTVEDYPSHPSNPSAVVLTIGQYSEARLVGGTLQISGPFPAPNEPYPPEILDLLEQVRGHALDHLMPWNDALVVP